MSCATRTTMPSGLTTSAAQRAAPGKPSSFSSCHTGLPRRSVKAFFPSCVIHFRSVNKPKPCRSANARCDKPDRLYRRTHRARSSGVEYGLRRSEEKESFMPHFTRPNHLPATCTLPDAYEAAVQGHAEQRFAVSGGRNRQGLG